MCDLIKFRVSHIRKQLLTCSNAEVKQLVLVTFRMLGRVVPVLHPKRPEVARFVPEGAEGENKVDVMQGNSVDQEIESRSGDYRSFG